MLTRRQFLAMTAVGAASCHLRHRRLWAQEPAIEKKMKGARSALRILEIKAHEVLLPYHPYNALNLQRYHGPGIQVRSIFVVKTNAGFEGIGENWGHSYLKDEEIDKYLGTDPFDWVGDLNCLPLNMAMYDLMGKFLEVPAWRLIGPKFRSRIPVAAWTVSLPAEAMALEVKSVSERGYRWLKFHVDEVQNVIEQTIAMQDVAPEGFRVHYDFNGNSTYEKIHPLIKKLEKFPIAGRIEDPIVTTDRSGWRRLRAQTKLPLLVHHGPADFMIDGLCDGLMAGHAPIGAAAKTAAVAEATELPMMLQQCGGTINQSFLAQEAAVFKMATIDHVNLAHLWTDDVTVERMPVVDGHVTVLEEPGLGLTIDKKKLKQYARKRTPAQKPFLVRIRYQGGPTILCRHDPKPGSQDNLRLLERLLGKPIPGPTPGYDNDVVTDFWDDWDSPEFQRRWKEAATGPLVIDS
ncbi:MAG: mandelate racemase/muconate lactonizing enzyme family protein [Planctomycetaceae bacterium]|nr:mandelate racemase/muconate lactonizing enzyme family protein [Planctomycetaceae bacterium]